MIKFIKYVYEILCFFMPQTRFFNFKNFMLRKVGFEIGESVRICSSAKFYTQGKTSIGANTWIGHEVLVAGGDADIIIGDCCDIAPRVMILTGSHEIDRGGVRVAGKGFSSPIVIGRGTWLGAGSIILGGSAIGNNSVVAAGAVVKGAFPDNCIIGGVPAKIIRLI